jgi:hypothetical protein
LTLEKAFECVGLVVFVVAVGSYVVADAIVRIRRAFAKDVTKEDE